MKTLKVLVLNGPNLNMLGKRDPEVYGTKTLADINASIASFAEGMKISCDFKQSNCEGELIDIIHTVGENYDGCIINAGAYTHYSYAIRDAIDCVHKPFVEVHMSNIHARDEFRRTSVIAPVCCGSIIGFGANSYILAVSALRDIVDKA